MQGLCVGTASPWGHRTAPPPRSQTRLRIPPQPSARFPQPQPRGPGSYRKANAHGGGEGAWDELALVKLDQQRRLPHAAVSNQDGLQGARQGTSAHGGWRCPSVPPGCSFWGKEEKGRGLGGGSSRSRGAARPHEQPRWAAGCPHRLPGATARWLEPWCPVLRRHLWSCCLPGEGFPPLGASLTHGPAPARGSPSPPCQLWDLFAKPPGANISVPPGNRGPWSPVPAPRGGINTRPADGSPRSASGPVLQDVGVPTDAALLSTGPVLPPLPVPTLFCCPPFPRGVQTLQLLQPCSVLGSAPRPCPSRFHALGDPPSHTAQPRGSWHPQIPQKTQRIHVFPQKKPSPQQPQREDPRRGCYCRMPAPGAILGPHTTSSKTPVPQGAAKLWARLMQGMALIMEGWGGAGLSSRKPPGPGI